ncbi:MAG: tetraacyldisaccharide 4'-kinase [Gemmatimonadaceae bacterium]
MADERRGAERVWYGDDVLARAARLALSPLALGYRGVIALRNTGFDVGLLRSSLPPIPALSVGNLTVGGTGKTPFTAWMTTRLIDAGARPAIVLRGYGADEPGVHAVLNPGVQIVVAADRVRGIARAAEQGADVAVLDDAFQHRRVRRDVDLVLVSAERWYEHRHLLPAGPWREPLSSLARATAAVVTRKSASAERAASVASALERAIGGARIATVAFALGELRSIRGDGRPLAELNGVRVLAIAAIGDPGAFAAQLVEAGACVSLRAFADHHAFTRTDAEQLARDAATHDVVVCTLKDAVKLDGLWPRAAPPLWYVSQRISVERGATALDAALETVLRARARRDVQR